MEGTAGEKGRDKERREKVRNREGRSKERVRRTIPRVLRETNTKTGSQAEKDDQSKKWGASGQIPKLRHKDTDFCFSPRT